MVFEDNPVGIKMGAVSTTDFMFAEAATPAAQTFEDAGELLRESARSILAQCMAEMVGDVTVPLGWPGAEEWSVREFAAFVEGAADLIAPERLEELVALVLDTQRDDGAFADRITLDGIPVFGDTSSTDESGVLDLPQAVTNLVWHVSGATGNTAFVRDALDPLTSALKALPRNPKTDLVFLDPDTARIGRTSLFTDKHGKCGDLLVASLLYVRACEQMGDLCQSAGEDGKSDMWRAEGQQVAKRTRMYLWDKQVGLFRAATAGCTIPDVWGSALAVYANAATSGQLMSIGGFLKDNFEQVFRRGHMRHFAPYSPCDSASEAVGEGQNGGFWAFPAGWAAYSLNILAPDLANQLLIDLANAHAADGVYQWIAPSNLRFGANHLASVALPLNGLRRIRDKRQRLAL